VKSVRTLFALLFFILVVSLGVFVYQAIVHGKNVPADVQNSPDYTIALRSAERIRFIELGIAALIFPLVALALAFAKLPRVSWLRNILAGLAAFLVVFVVFARYMEGSFQNTFPTAPLPLTALQTAGTYAFGGIALVWFVFFVAERFHAWRVAK
jgi:hypothetical protein